MIAWAGAGAFMASLLVGAWMYVLGFDAGRPRLPGPAAVTRDVLLFSIFALHHSAMARSGVKRRLQRIVPAELERSLYTWTSSLLFMAVCLLWEPVAGRLYQASGAWRWAGYAVQLAGVVLTVRSSAALDVFELAGVRQVQRARDGTRASPSALRTDGLYGVVRHPLYLAWALMVWGAPDMTATRATFATVSTVYLVLAISWEERGLVQTFGSAYEAYRRSVRWKMVPGLY